MTPPRDARAARDEEINIRIEVENLTRLVAQLIDANGHLRPAELAALREMIEERKDIRRYRRNLRIYTGYFAAAVIFFYTIREYTALFWAWIKAALK